MNNQPPLKDPFTLLSERVAKLFDLATLGTRSTPEGMINLAHQIDQAGGMVKDQLQSTQALLTEAIKLLQSYDVFFGSSGGGTKGHCVGCGVWADLGDNPDRYTWPKTRCKDSLEARKQKATHKPDCPLASFLAKVEAAKGQQ